MDGLIRGEGFTLMSISFQGGVGKKIKIQDEKIKIEDEKIKIEDKKIKIEGK